MERNWTMGYGGMADDDYAVIVNQDNQQVCTLEPIAYTPERAALICIAPMMRDSLRELTAIIGEYRRKVIGGELTGNLIKDDCEPYLKAEKILRTLETF